jgi:hypothetical protein
MLLCHCYHLNQCLPKCLPQEIFNVPLKNSEPTAIFINFRKNTPSSVRPSVHPPVRSFIRCSFGVCYRLFSFVSAFKSFGWGCGWAGSGRRGRGRKNFFEILTFKTAIFLSGIFFSVVHKDVNYLRFFFTKYQVFWYLGLIFGIETSRQAFT